MKPLVFARCVAFAFGGLSAQGCSGITYDKAGW